MALDIDIPPVEGQDFSYEFQLWLTSFYQTLTEFMSSNGIFLPVLTTVQRDKILVSSHPDQVVSPVQGQMIWNSTLKVPQVWNGTTWKTFTIV